MFARVARALSIGLVALGVLAASEAGAQASRNGVRIQLGQVAGSGALSGTAFLPIAPSTIAVERLEGTPCDGLRIAGTGRLTRGAIRGVAVTMLVTATGMQGRLGVAACPGATISLEMEDGTTIDLDRGELDITERDLVGGRVAASFRATGARNGDPITVTGDIRLAFAVPGAR